jgi:hypothetical protein
MTVSDDTKTEPPIPYYLCLIPSVIAVKGMKEGRKDFPQIRKKFGKKEKSNSQLQK